MTASVKLLIEKPEPILAILATGVLIAIVLLVSPNHYVYDENVFAANFGLINQVGISKELFVNLKEQSPGPLYQIVHYVFSDITGYAPKAIRALNLMFFLLSLPLLVYAAKKETQSTLSSFTLAALSIPAVWVIGGMALTEIPAVFFLSLALYFLFKSERHPYSTVLILLSGISLGLAVMGRTQFLLAIIPFVYWLRLDLKKIALFLLGALPIPGYMFFTWQGLVPPDVADIQSGFNLWYATLGLGYLALFTLFVQPNWYAGHLNSKALLIGVLLAALLLPINYLFAEVRFIPARTVVTSIFGSEQIVNLIGLAFPIGILMAGVFFLYCSYKNTLVHKDEPQFMLGLLGTLLIVASTAKSSAQFSSRYIGQAFPFMILYCSFIPNNRLNTVFLVLGAIFGIASLLSYYN